MRPHLIDQPTCREDFDMPLVSKAMSHLNRYGGRGLFPIPLATHCYALATVVPDHLRAAALMHDVSELWFGDVPSPVKRKCPDYVFLENAFITQIGTWFAISPSDWAELKEFDLAIRHDELAAAFPDFVDAGARLALGVGRFFVPTDPAIAAGRWLQATRDFVS